MAHLNIACHDEHRVDRSKRKTCSLSIRVTPDELERLAEQASAEGCISISEYARNVLFRAPKVKGQRKEYRMQIAHLEKDVEDLRQDVGRLWSRLSE